MGVLLSLHRTIDKVDQTLSEIQEQTQLASEVSEAISSSTYVGVEFDEVRHSSYQSRALSEMSIHG